MGAGPMRTLLYALGLKHSVPVVITVPNGSQVDYDTGCETNTDTVYTAPAIYLPAKSGYIRYMGSSQFVKYAGTLLFEKRFLQSPFNKATLFAFGDRTYRVAEGADSIVDLWECDCIEVTVATAEV